MSDKTQKMYQKALEDHRNGQIDRAENTFKKIVKQHPNHGESLFALGKIAMQKQRLVLAEKYFRQLLQYYPNHGDSWTNIGLILYQHYQNIPDAITSLTKALENGAQPAPIYLYLADIFKNSGDLNTAKDMYEKAINAKPDMAQAHLGLATICVSLHLLDTAETHFIQALNLDPNNNDILLNLLILTELSGQNIDGKLPSTLSEQNKQFCKAWTHQKQGETDKAIDIFENLETPDSIGVETYRLFTLGQLYDKAGNYTKAFDYISQANTLQNQTIRAKLIDRDYYPARLNATLSAVDSGIFSQNVQKRTLIEKTEKKLVFVIGFPRSGTTLTGRILSVSDQVHVNDERGVLGQLSHIIQAEFGLKYPEDLPQLSDQQRQQLQQTYWQEHKKSPLWREKPVFIDKFPLNVIHLPLISVLFPDARVIFVQRHPLDSILSALMQNFHLNEAMIHLSDVVSAAALYRNVLSIWFQAQEKISIRSHTIRYENIVEDFKAEVSAMLNFLDLPWQDDMQTFYKKKADSFQTITPSATQVTQKLYSSSKGRWHHYKPQLEHAKEALDDIIQTLGYTS